MKLAKPLYLSVLLLNLVIISGFWGGPLLEFLPTTLPLWLVAFGRLTGLLAVFAILHQVFLMSRVAWLEQAFGQDGLARIHKQTGRLAYTLLVAHPLLIVAGYSAMGKINWWQQLQILWSSPAMVQATLSVVLFTIVVGTSIYLVRNRIKYEWWYAIHLLTYLAILLSWNHQLQFGSDFLTQPWMVRYWYLLYGLVLAQWLWFRILTPLWRFLHHDLKIAKTKLEKPGVLSIYLTGRNLDQLGIKPGQFGFFRFLQPNLALETHPFSFSQLAQPTQLRITAKQLGDFTQALSTLKTGTRVWLEGPYGIFTPQVAKATSPVLLIAGGIGITPLRSLVESFATAGRDIVFIYSNKTLDEAVFASELAELSQKYRFPIYHFLSQVTGKLPANSFAGRLDAERLKKLVPQLTKRDVYVCGSPPFMKATLENLRQLGVPNSQLHYELFEL